MGIGNRYGYWRSLCRSGDGLIVAEMKELTYEEMIITDGGSVILAVAGISAGFCAGMYLGHRLARFMIENVL